ncbi:aryl-sulfate sulfohydrolase [Pedobacter sp. KBW06]|uniref:sulfatase n=1 Tax=Pedobacter sp. KBW06 TaxID=2153359 RepID=UPI000F5AB8B1|nr:sulfatase [Pedobacter sp. KBW06]RQO74700.1 aryl-sulfate sulfohydrolase [Pedobacter sp. KBW06]
MKLGLKIVVILCFAFNLAVAQHKRPNILIILVDDMGWRDAGFMGSEFYETPVIDSLVRQGMVFTNSYASAANCAPSRASLMSGKWMPRHGIYTVGNSDRGKSADRKLVPVVNTLTLDPKFKTLAQSLKENGYNTCLAGKWHLSDDPVQYGFEVNIGGSHAGSPASYYPPYKNIKLTGPDNRYLTDLVMDKTVDYVKNVSGDKPFFLYYASYAVHTPIQKIDSLLYRFENKKAWEGQSNKAYATMLKNEDQNIGRLLSALKAKGELDNTFIIFTSDNGGLNQVTFQHPLRAGKGSYFEGGIRVPTAFIWKGKVKAGTHSDLPVTNLDFYPTLMEVAKASTTEELDGHSLYAYLQTQKPEAALADRPLYWYFPIYLEGGNQESNDPVFRTRPGEALRKGNWKLHHYFEDNSLQLYNLKDDVGERNNVAEKFPGKTKELLELLKQLDQKTKAPAVTELNPGYSGIK